MKDLDSVEAQLRRTIDAGLYWYRFWRPVELPE
jgi:hypothetical protein